MGAKEFFRAKAPLGYDPQFWTCVQLVHYCFLYWVDRAQNQLLVSWLLTVLRPFPQLAKPKFLGAGAMSLSLVCQRVARWRSLLSAGDSQLPEHRH